MRGAGNSVLCSLLDGLSGPTTRARIWRGLTQEDAVARTLREHRAILSYREWCWCSGRSASR